MHSPHERERVKNALLKAGLPEKEIEENEVVDNALAIAEELHKLWLRHTPEASKLAPPQRTGGGMGLSPPNG
ncbi:MAG TPA: hypothetical protein VJA87_03685 [Candidatus Paceibacterota bacterium]